MEQENVAPETSAEINSPEGMGAELDSFFGSEEVDVQPTPAVEVQPTGEQQPAAPAATAPAPSAEPTAPVVPAQPNAQAAIETEQPNAGLTAEAIAEAVKAAMGTQSAEAETGAAPQATLDDLIPNYGAQLNIPEQVLNLIGSEDPAERNQGVKTLASGIMATVHRQVLGQMQTLVKDMYAHLPQVIMQQTQQENAQRQVHDDFYGKFQGLNNPAIKPVVKAVWDQYLAKNEAAISASGWNAQHRDALGQAVYATLGMQIPAAAPAPTPVPVAPTMMKGSNAGAARPNPTPVSGHSYDLDDF